MNIFSNIPLHRLSSFCLKISFTCQRYFVQDSLTDQLKYPFNCRPAGAAGSGMTPAPSLQRHPGGSSASASCRMTSRPELPSTTGPGSVFLPSSRCITPCSAGRSTGALYRLTWSPGRTAASSAARGRYGPVLLGILVLV